MTDALFRSLDSASIACAVRKAQHSVCYAAPGIQQEPAKAMAELAQRIGPELITVCLDFDERVMRMGFGDLAAVKTLREAGIVIGSTSGLRTGLVIVDHHGYIFTPIALYLEADERPTDSPRRKIRTYPLSYGHTTALEITDAADVRRQGCDIVKRLKLTGVAKLDFKRDPRGNLRLLEINPRFNLWHHPGALAGVNIPALVYADLTGSPRPPAARVKAGVRWCRPWKDLPAARAAGMPLTSWASWALGCEAKSTLSLDDPLPFLRSTFYRLAGGNRGSEQTGVWRGRIRIGS